MQTETSRPRNGIHVAYGWGLKIYVNRGHLVVDHGIGTDRETHRFNRATSGLKRLVVVGRSGFVTLDALRWIKDVKAAFVQLDPDGKLVCLTAPAGTDLPPLRRAQALAAYTDTGLVVARLLLTEKTDGQAALLPELDASDETRRAMRNAGHAIAAASTVDELVAAEAAAASAYWDAWAPVHVPFGPRDAQHVPDHWRTFGQRHSPLTGSPRLAINPANAILNYLYALLEAEATLACSTIGLDPGLGIFHTDKRGRASLALDVMEACRPLVDAYLLTLLRQRTLNRRDLAETRRGDCRILPPLAERLATTVGTWQQYVAPAVERVAQTIGDHATDPFAVPTNLTGTHRKAAWQRRQSQRTRSAPLAPLPTTCRGCGAELANRRRRYCDACRQASAERAGHSGRAAATIALARLRDEGLDPAHGGDTARRRGSKNAQHQRELAKWQPKPGAVYDRDDFRERTADALRDVSIDDLAQATGLSAHYCSLIRLGKRTPHPRHWLAIEAALTPNARTG